MTDLVSEETISQLSLRAGVAYAARAVRRIEPIGALVSRDTSLLSNIDTAIRAAEEFTRGGFFSADQIFQISRSIDQSSRLVFATLSNRRALTYTKKASHYIACTSGKAVLAASHTTSKMDHYEAAIQAAAHAVDFSVKAAHQYKSKRLFLCELAHDYEYLSTDHRTSCQQLGSPIDLVETERVRPLWTNAPDWYGDGILKRQKYLASPKFIVSSKIVSMLKDAHIPLHEMVSLPKGKSSINHDDHGHNPESVEEMIGQRLLTLLGVLAKRQSIRDPKSNQLLVLNSDSEFTQDIKEEMIHLLNLNSLELNQHSFFASLSKEFYEWAHQTKPAHIIFGTPGSIDENQLFILCSNHPTS